MSPFKLIRKAAVFSLALGLLAAAPTQSLAEIDEPLAAEIESTLSQPIALAPSADGDADFLPQAKKETIAAVSVPEVAPQVASRVLPTYPEFARKARLQGMVFARVLVDERGKVAKVGDVEGHAIFRDAVKVAAEKWEFTPAKQGDRPVRSWVTVPFSFEM